MSRLRTEALVAAIRDRMLASGVDNYMFSDGHLRIGTRRYAVTGCACGEEGCDGLRLRPVRVARPQMG